MISSFFGLHLASKALQAHQRAMDVTGHNIANANTEGYSRQIVDYTASTPLPPIFNGVTSLQFGTGVELSQIRRARNQFLDGQVRLQNWIEGYSQAKSEILSQVEDVLHEPSDTGLSSTINTFFNAWQELTTDAESTAARSNLRESARTMTVAFQDTARQLGQMQSDLNESVKDTVSEINSFTKQIAELNAKINEVTVLNGNPNDLMDKRDLLIEKLSKLTDVQVVAGKNNQSNVFIYGKAIVREDESVDLAVQEEPVSTAIDGISKLVFVKWSDDLAGSNVNLSSGKLKGILDSRGSGNPGDDGGLVKYSDKLNTLVSTIVSEFNTQHQAGFGLDGSTLNNFFDDDFDNDGITDIVTALNFSLSEAIDGDLKKIAAAGLDITTGLPGGPGDASNALLMVQLKYLTGHLDPDISNSTYEDYYNGVIAGLGVESAEAQRVNENQQFLLAQIDERRLSTSGVSLDEEMTNMLMYQRSYEAAARVVTAVDEMLDTLINRMGLVGR
jgi:flagellar hook-associated protein 1 FlgK